MKLRQKIMVAIVMLVIVPVTAMAVISNWMFTKSIERKTSEFYWVSLQETNWRLQLALRSIDSVSDLGITQPLVQRILKGGHRTLTEAEVEEINNLFLSHPNITSVHLYSGDRLIYSSDHRLELPSHFQIEPIRKLYGLPFWLGPFEHGFAGEDGMMLVHARMIKDYYSLEDIGALVLTVKPEVLEQVFWQASILRHGDILLVNRDGTILFSKSGDYLGERYSFPFLTEPTADSYTDTYRGEKTFITHLETFHPEWHLVALTSWKDIRAQSYPIRIVAFGLLVLSLITIILFDRLFIYKIVRAIVKVVNGMKRVEQGNFTTIEPVKMSPRQRVDETDLLLIGFNRMNSQIRELIQRVEGEQKSKKQAEIQALVAQINPHFIYNSLEAINSLAVLQGNKDISKMVVALGKLLRISISDYQEMIPLSLELEHVRSYLSIQKYRFEDKFHYEIHLDEKIRSCMTLKLIVQPIVENALYHGIEPSERTGFIRIRAWKGTDAIWIEVADNGCGFDANQISEPLPRDRRQSGVGIRNVHERIRLSFGPRYGVMICTAPQEGTIVRIRIPDLEKGEQLDAPLPAGGMI